MKLTYYPGCSLHSTAYEYHASTCAVFQALGVELEELADWNCCGATSAHATNHYLSLALPLRNLILAERAGHDIVVPCAACYNALKTADHQIRQHDASAAQVNASLRESLGAAYAAAVNVRHPLEILSRQDMLRAIRAKAVRPLTGLKVVAYYGCLLSRPKDSVAFDNPDHPQSMDKILAALGAEVRRWSYKTDCCGAGLTLPQAAVVEALAGKLAAAAARAGAQAIVAACSMCMMNLDTRQEKAPRQIPVFYFTELMGASFNLPEVKSWLARHIIDPAHLLSLGGH